MPRAASVHAQSAHIVAGCLIRRRLGSQWEELRLSTSGPACAIYKSGLTLVWPNRFASSSALPSVLSGAIVTIPLCASHSFVCATQAHAATTPYAYTDTIISGPNSGRCTEHSHSAADLPAPSHLIVNTSHCRPARDRSCLPFCFFFYRQVLRPL